MATVNRSDYAGLPFVDGIKLGNCSLSYPVSCPFCSNPDAALVAGRISFAATMGGEVITDKEPLAAFVCPNSHLFLLREQDVVAIAPPVTSLGRTVRTQAI
jgi:hypothetical protein